MPEAGGILSPGGLWERFVDGKFPPELGQLMNGIDFTEVVVHIDLDCLNTTIGKANKYAAPGGLQEADLHNYLYVLPRKVLPLALIVASFDPTLEGGDRIAVAGVRAIAGLISEHSMLGVFLTINCYPTHADTTPTPPEDEVNLL